MSDFVNDLVRDASDAELSVLIAGGLRFDPDVARAALAEKNRRHAHDWQTVAACRRVCRACAAVAE